MMISLINFIISACLFCLVYIVKNRLSKLKDIKVLDARKIRSAWFLLSFSVLVAGMAWFFETQSWMNVIASLLSLMGTSVFFKTTQVWFKNTQKSRIKKEDLVSLFIWCLWLLSGSVFLANIIVILIY